MDAINNAVKREEFFTRLYKKAFPTVAKYIANRGGTFDEAKDIFQDALVIYYEKEATGNLPVNSNETAYIVGTAKHLWLKRFKDSAWNIPLDGIDVIDIDVNKEASAQRIIHFLEKSGRKCMELLKSFYYDQHPLTEIAEMFGFSGTRSATVQKYKCLEKVRETVKQKALQYEDFME